MNSPEIAKASRKRGIGIMEVMVAALVLGLLYAAVSNLQKGNHDALLRIRGRDGATEIAQNIIDSLGALGLASFSDENLIPCGENCLALAKIGEDGTPVENVITVTRTWQGQPGIIQNNITVKYNVRVRVSSDNEQDPADNTYYYKAQTGSMLLLQDPEKNKKCGDDGTNCVSHVYAKRLDVTVSWPFKNSMQSISVSGVIR